MKTVVYIKCPTCKGKGMSKNGVLCGNCGGSGTIKKENT